MVAILICFVILGCFESKTDIQKAREYLLHEPKRAMQYIQRLSPEEQLYIVTQLSEELPHRVAPLCNMIRGDAQNRCKRLAKRPHLWESTNTQVELPIAAECAHPHICLEQEAISAIEQGDVAVAIQACTKIQEAKWAHECVFHCAESILEQDVNRYADTLSVCEQSGSFRNNCVQHGIFAIVSTWLEQKYTQEDVEHKIINIKKVWDEHNTNESAIRIDQLWAHWMFRYAEQNKIDIDTLPSHLQTHHHSNIATSAVQFAMVLDSDLESHVVRLQKNTLAKQQQRRGMEPMMNLWNTPVPDHGRSFLGYSFRLTDPDPKIDLLIATLEATARLQPPQMSRITPYAKHDHPKVQATAQRLLQFDTTQPSIQPIVYNP